MLNDSEKTKTHLAFSVLMFALIMIIGLFFFDIPKENKDLINILLGAIVGWTGAIVSFYFGSSDRDNKRRKEDV